jgi:AraC-like DNA-binding protein
MPSDPSSSSPGIPLVRLSQVLPFTRWLESEGVPTGAMLRACSLPTEPAGAPDRLVAGRTVWDWTERAARAEGIEDLGMRVGRSAPVQEIGALGRSVEAAATLRGALDTFVRQVNRHSSHASFGWSVQGEHAWLWRRATPGSAASGQAEQYVLMLMRQIVRLAAGPGWTPGGVVVGMRTVPPTLREELSSARVDCGASLTAIRMPLTLLSLRLRAPRPPEGRRLPEPPLGFVESLRQAVESALPVLAPGVDWGAEIAGTSPRTLQRRLRSHGLTWFELVDGVRKDTALRLLGDPAMRTHDVAHAVGYADPANFSHAFRRWTGATPSDYRCRARAREGSPRDGS